MPFISVIIPIYNKDKDLERCIDSVLAQTCSDFEVILINDGSTDASQDICNRYAQKDSRVTAFYKMNGGVSSARNLGLRHAKGTWVTFIDSDDWVSPSYLEHLIDHVTNDVDLVFSYATIYYSNGQFKSISFPSKRISSDEIELALIENELHGYTSPWSKLYRMEIVKRLNLNFIEDMHIGEDAVFLFSYIQACRYIYFSEDTDYFYSFDVNNSLTKRVNSLDSELLGYHKISDVIRDMCILKGIKNPIALHKLNWILGYYARRVLNSLYHNKICKRKRIEIIQSIDLAPYLNELHISSYKEIVLSYLLKARLFHLYDTMRNLHRYIRKI